MQLNSVLLWSLSYLPLPLYLPLPCHQQNIYEVFREPPFVLYLKDSQGVLQY